MRVQPPVLTHVRLVVDDFDRELATYAAAFFVQGGFENAKQTRCARLWRCAEPNEAEIELIERDGAVEILGEGPLSGEKITLLFNVDDVEMTVRAFVGGGATVVEPVKVLNRAGSKRAILRDPNGVLLEISRPVAESFGALSEARS